MKNTIIVVVCLTGISVLIQGCVPLVIGAAVYSHQENKTNYNKYLENTENINTDREEHGLKPIPIMTYKEWSGQTGSIMNSSTNTPTSSGHK